MKKIIQQITLLTALTFGFANVIEAQIVKPITQINQGKLIRKNIQTGFAPLAQTYKTATVLTTNNRFAKSLVPVAEKQYTITLCSNDANSDVSYEAHNVNGVGFGAIYFDLGTSYLFLNINAKADAYYLFELNISGNGTQFSINSKGVESKVSSTKEKLSFIAEVKKGDNRISISSNNPWSFASAQVTLLKN